MKNRYIFGLLFLSAIAFAAGETHFPKGIKGNLIGNASTATALASNPADCAAGEKALSIDAQGNLTCAAVLGSEVTQSALYRLVTDTEKALWNGKQDALGFTPENVANKDNGALGSSSTTYPTSGAVKSYVDTGLSGKQASGNYVTSLTGDVTASGPGAAAASVVKIKGVTVDDSAIADGKALVYKSASGNLEYGTVAGGGGTPGGSDTQIQYNNSGSFGGDSKLTFSSSTGELKLTSATSTSSLYIGTSGGAASPVAANQGADNVMIGKGTGAAASSTAMKQSVHIGSGAGDAATTGHDNVILGYNAATNGTTLANAVVIGSGAGAAFVAGGGATVNIGLNSNVTAANTTNAVAVGPSTTVATNSVAIGDSASAKGDSTVAVGRLAGGSNLAAYGAFLGYGAGSSQNTGGAATTGNSLLGYNAGSGITSGLSNTATGASAGTGLTSGSGNSFFGTNAKTTKNTLTDSTALGARAQVNNDAAISIGASTVSSGFGSINIGYGSTVSGNRAVAIGMAAATEAYAGAVAIGTDSAGNGATATHDNDFVLGASTHNVIVPGSLNVAGPIFGTSASRNFVPNSAGVMDALNWSLTDGNGVGAGAPTFVRDTTAGKKIGGIASLAFTAVQNLDDITSDAMTLTDDVIGQDCEAAVYYTTTATVYTLNLVSGSTVLKSVPLAPSSTFRKESINYPCGTNYKVRIAATGAGAVINFGAYWGLATNTGAVAQATMMGSITIKTCASPWSTGNTAPGTFGTKASCVYTTTGQALQPSTNLLAIKFATLPPGEYMIRYEGKAYQATTSKSAWFRFTDGTNSARETSSIFSSGGEIDINSITQTFTLTTASIAPTWELQGWTDASGTVGVNGTDTNPGVITLYRFPSQTETAVRADQSAAYFNGSLVGAGGGWAYTTGAFADPTVATTSSTLTSMAVSGMTVVAESTKLPAITITPSRPGAFQVCSSLNITNSGAAGTGTRLRLNVGATVIATGSNLTSPVTNYTMQETLCGIYEAASTAAFTVKWQGYDTANTTSITQSADIPITWTVVGVSQQLPAPLLVGSVTSNSPGLERVERVTLGQSGTSAPTVTTQSGLWIGTPTRSAVGQYALPVTSGIFSATPTCTCGAGTAGTNIIPCVATATSTTNINISTANNTNTAWVDAGGPITILCQGQR